MDWDAQPHGLTKGMLRTRQTLSCKLCSALLFAALLCCSGARGGPLPRTQRDFCLQWETQENKNPGRRIIKKQPKPLSALLCSPGPAPFQESREISCYNGKPKKTKTPGGEFEKQKPKPSRAPAHPSPGQFFFFLRERRSNRASQGLTRPRRSLQVCVYVFHLIIIAYT